MTYEIHQNSVNHQYFWKLLADNGKSIAIGGELYNNKKDCESGISKVKLSFAAPVVDKTLPSAADVLAMMRRRLMRTSGFH